MTNRAGLTGMQGGAIAAVIVAVVVGAGVYLSDFFSNNASPVDLDTEKVALLPKAGGTPAVVEAEVKAAEPQAKTAEPEVPADSGDGEKAISERDAAVAEAITPPGFDLVRVEADGTATVAGRAAPSALVAILLDGVTIETLAAGEDGSFAGFLSLGAVDVARVLSLSMQTAAGETVASVEQVILAPSPRPVPVEVAEATELVTKAEPAEPVAQTVPEQEAAMAETAAEPVAEATTTSAPEASEVAAPAKMATGTAIATEQIEVAEAAPETSAGTEVAVIDAQPETAGTETQSTAEPAAMTAAEPVVAAATAKPETQPVAAAEPETEAEPVQAPAVLLATESGVKVLQPVAPQVMSSVALDTISYSDEGEVQLAGRGQGTGYVRVYLDNAPVTTSRIEADGNWRTGLPDVDTGIYTLRVDEIDADGAVISRVETPFKREAQELVTEAAPVRAVTVQPGSTLWAIARENYGEGVLYVRLFEANRDRIRNPDLIYPGQVFDIPRD